MESEEMKFEQAISRDRQFMNVGGKRCKFANAWHYCRITERSASRMLNSQEIEKLAVCGKRFELVKEMLKYVPKGIRRIADVEKVGAANVEKCTMAVKEWDETVGAREENEQCRGVFFTSFGFKHSLRRCEAVAEEKGMCGLCKRMREEAEKKGSDVVTVEGQKEYEIIKKALFKREGVMECMAFWDNESQKLKKECKLEKDYPYFSAQEMVSLLMVQAGVIFHDGGKGGRMLSLCKPKTSI